MGRLPDHVESVCSDQATQRRFGQVVRLCSRRWFAWLDGRYDGESRGDCVGNDQVQIGRISS
eukprot:5793788-Pleurochrysis_carterae.AAC.1